MDPTSVLLVFGFIRETMKVAQEVKDIMTRVEAGETITKEELQIGEEAQLAMNNKIQDM